MNLKDIFRGASKKINKKKEGNSLKRTELKTLSLSSDNIPIPRKSSLLSKEGAIGKNIGKLTGGMMGSRGSKDDVLNNNNPEASKNANRSFGLRSFNLLGFGKKKKTITNAASPLSSAQTTSPATSQPPSQPMSQSTSQGSATNSVFVTKRGFKLPIIGKKTLLSQLVILLVITAIFMLFSIGATVYYQSKKDQASAYTNITSQMQFQTQRLAKSGGLAGRGDALSFAQLQDSRDEFQRYLDILNTGGEAFSVQVPSASVSEELTSRLNELTKRFQDLSGAATAILAAKADLIDLSGNIEQIRSGTEDLATLSQDLTGLMQQLNAPPSQILKVNLLTFYAERLGRNSAEFLGSDVIDPKLSFLMSKDNNNFRDLIKALESGSDALGVDALIDVDAKERVVKLREQFVLFEKSIKPILGNVQKLVAARQSGRVLQQGSEQLLASVEQLQVALDVERNNFPLLVALFFGFLALATLILLAVVFLGDASRRAAREAFKNQTNQESIDNLLNEMDGVAAGNLKTRLSVESDFTGSVAQAVNQSVEALQRTVLRIKQTSRSVTSKTEEADKVTEDVLADSQRQFDELQGAAQNIGKMASNADEIAQLTFLVSEESSASQQASRQGGEIVAQTIERMDKMRETTQEAAKRIKRLGESSQSIGEAIILIQDITRQVNVLALNTAIHAASTGPSGRAFGVVAQEVQRLASDSEEATLKIEALVATIQQDTNQAVAVMERTTQEVVEGTRLASAAGQALVKIDGFAGKVNEMVASVNKKLEEQSSEFTDMSLSMRDLGKLTENNMSGIRSAVSKVEEVKLEARLLEESVSDFKVD